MVQEFTRDQVASHSSKDDLYLIIRNKVYNASEFVAEHPGGEEVLLEIAGRDATEAYEDVGHSEEADEILVDLFVGELSANLDAGNPGAVIETSKPVTGYSKQGLTISQPRREATESAPNSLSSFLVRESFQETELVEKTSISHNVVMSVKFPPHL
uniref:Cytochrome b5 heme-binding domain-containing protein n=1 Tax=Bionectria ochroleuca TaxID=29856 RepID=A0A0B7JUK1_BIOOC